MKCLKKTNQVEPGAGNIGKQQKQQIQTVIKNDGFYFKTWHGNMESKFYPNLIISSVAEDKETSKD